MLSGICIFRAELNITRSCLKNTCLHLIENRERRNPRLQCYTFHGEYGKCETQMGLLKRGLMVTDKQLMQAVAAGDPEAFREIILRHQRVAWNTAYRFLRDPMEAEDIVQETFVRILEAAPRYQPNAKFRTYLYRILTRLCIDHARKKRPLLVDSIADLAHSAPGPLEDLIFDEREAEVHAHLDVLPPNQKAAIILKHFEGLSYAEISQVMGISQKAVERLLSRARRTLQSRLSHLNKI